MGETVRRRPCKDKVPSTTKGNKRKEAASPGLVNKYVAGACAILLSVALIRVMYIKPNTLTSPSYLPLIYPDCCTGNEEQLSRLWGSYRPQVYFGMRPRIPESVIFGLMWMPVHNPEYVADHDFRHTAEQNSLKSFTWTHHDGIRFGVQLLKDKGYTLETSFVKTNVMLQDWSARIKVQGAGAAETPHAMHLYWYLGVEHTQSTVKITQHDHGFSVYGETAELGKFHMKYRTVSATAKVMHSAYNCGEGVPLHLLTDYTKSNLKPIPYKGRHVAPILVGFEAPSPPCKDTSNVIIMQLTVPLDAQVEVVYENLNIHRTRSLEGSYYNEVILQHMQEFKQKFEAKFKLKSKGYSQEYIKFARHTFSNLIGGIGYFYGKSIVKSSEVEKPEHYWPAALYSAVPSRSFFPRGFLWDEGFHQLLISKWDNAISLEVIGHWLNLMNADGWIPREQILGNEARMKVPPEFVIQNADYANPPTMFLALDSMFNSMQPSELLDHHSTLKKVFHRLTLWYNWYNTTQTGPLPTSYRWRGRNGTTDRELNPKTLTSGLDDYPRATHPTDSEYHLDLRCWMAFASRSLANLGDLLGINVDRYKETAEILTDNELLKKLHWTGDYFADYGHHSEVVGLASVRVGQTQNTEKRRVVRKLPQDQFVKVRGYINIFPFILMILEPTSPELGHILNNLKSEANIWSAYGLCSVSKQDSYYLKHNTQHDGPYWRGPVWININFLAVRALDHYSKVPGPYQEISRKLYKELRRNVVDNMYREYERTGYVWEQYSCQTGRGQSVHPFTGWSSLVVLMMGEEY